MREFREEGRRHAEPVVTQVARGRRDPFRVLVSCLISLRTKDEVTHEASRRLFEIAPDVHRLRRLPPSRIARTIYPAGFYRTKGETLRRVAVDLIDRFDGRVPDTIEELLTLHGVGRKTANLVVSLGYGKPGICVDTHVHRVSNRVGLCRTKTPDQTEMALREVLPGRYWIEFNDLLVTYGRNVCTPLSPHCSTCRVREACPRVGVTRSR